MLKNIDSPLYDYGLMSNYDINNYFINKKYKLFLKFKSYVITIWVVFNIIRYIFYLFKSNNGKVHNNYYDIVQHFGGLTEFYYAITIFTLILLFYIIYIFNYSDSDLYQ